MNNETLVHSELLRGLINELASLRKAVLRLAGQQLKSETLRNRIRKSVQEYFRTVRPPFAALTLDVSNIDAGMQELMAMADRNSSVSRYKSLLARLARDLSQLDIGSEQHLSDIAAKSGDQIPGSSIEVRILETVKLILPTTARSYQQVLLDLSGNERFSYRGTATELREILREVLDHMAPDSEVKHSPHFQLEKDRTRPTMAQKVRFILRNRGIPKNSSAVPEKAVDTVEAAVASLVRSTYDRGSIDTHTADGISRAKVVQLKMYMDSVLSELLEIYKNP